LPSKAEILSCNLDLQTARFLGLLDEHHCYALEVPAGVSLSDSLKSIPLRDIFAQFSANEIKAISLAKQIITWDKQYRFCGQCGQPTIELSDERAKVCRKCGLTNYPRLSPSIIVSVVKGKQILLARSARFPKGMYSVLAGFVEPGETLEECIIREIDEEVGIKVKNIKYFGSQNWPFPHSLMIAFTTDYAGGKITIDNNEIVDAKWFAVDDLPRLPGSYSIARSMIDHFCDSSSSAR
jgi:NAD+ diphosphatase